MMPLRAWLAVAVLTVPVVYFVAANLMARHGGTEIVLETAPVDPRDVFFGHYAVLNYPRDDIQMPETWKADGRTTYRIPRGARLAYRVENERLKERIVPPADALQPGELSFRLDAGEHSSWQSPRVTLPSSYFADPKTALALERYVQEAEREIANERRAFLEAEQERADAAGEEFDRSAAWQRFEETAPNRSRVILSMHDGGRFRIKGLIIDGVEYRESFWQGQRQLAAKVAPVLESDN